MQPSMVTYLLALDIFALTALIMAVGPIMNAVRNTRKRILLALFGLVLVRSVYLLTALAYDAPPTLIIASLEVFSIVCITWALIKPSAINLPAWRLYARSHLVVTLFLAVLLWAIPGLAWQPMVLIAAFTSFPLVFSRYDKVRWSHIITPLILGAAAALNWMALDTTSQFLSLLGYGTLIYAIFIETAIQASARQREVETLGAEAQRVQSERAQFMGISNLLSAAPSPAELFEHAVQTIGKATQVDQAVILAFDPHDGRANVAAIYRPYAPKDYNTTKETPFVLADYALLLDALETQGQLAVNPESNPIALKKLHSLWQDPTIGPTVLQPLLLKQRAVGMLILSNSLSPRAIGGATLRLCQKLGAQLAALVAYAQEQRFLQSQAESLSARLQLIEGKYKQLSDIVETLTEGIIASNTDGRIHLVNLAAEQLLGQSRQHLLARPIGTIFSDSNSSEAIEKLAVEFSRGNRALPTYFERDGQAVQGRLIPFRNERQEWLGIVAVLRDVTTEVYTDETRSKFVDTLSKELRTPLTTINGYLDLLLSGAAGELDIQQKHWLQIIRAGAERANDVINKAQRSVDKEANIIKLAVNKVDIKKVIHSSSSNLASLIKSKNINFKLDLAPDLPQLQADEAILRQILDGLLENACHNTGENGLVALSAWSLSEGVNGHQSEYLIIAVSDNGVSIPGDAQAPDAGSNLSQPEGLINGLVQDRTEIGVIKELVESHGGRLWMERIDGQGNSFQVALPCTLY